MPKLTKKQISKLLVTIKSWDVGSEEKPEYRRYKCGNCLKEINKAWHIWFECEEFKCEVHLCKKCGKKFGL